MVLLVALGWLLSAADATVRDDPDPEISPEFEGFTQEELREQMAKFGSDNVDKEQLDKELEDLMQKMGADKLDATLYDPSSPGVSAPVDDRVEFISRVEGVGEKESVPFQTETSRLMDIIVHSLYSNKHVFMRELISNASDALEKARVTSVTSTGPVRDLDDLAIYIETFVAGEDKFISITDTGIGMSSEELAKQLGTIAHSGSASFLEAASTDSTEDLIGQFGVGFYSAFLVSDEVIVSSQTADSSERHIWRSKADGRYEVFPDVGNEDRGVGTVVTLRLKNDASKFSEPHYLRKIIEEHSKFVQFPIFLRINGNWKHLNAVKPIWKRPKGEVERAEYNKFYRFLSADQRPPLEILHYHGEGEVEFKALLFMPESPSDMNDVFRKGNKRGGLKLYANNVLVTDTPGILLPDWLDFIVGVVETNDLPMKVDREFLTDQKQVNVIRKKLTNLVLDRIGKYYKDFVAKGSDEAFADPSNAHPWQKLEAFYTPNLYAGCYDGDSGKNVTAKIFKMLRFASLGRAPGKFTTIEEMADVLDQKEGGEKDPIFFIWNQDIGFARENPMLEVFAARGHDVLFLSSSAADRCLQSARKYREHKLESVEEALPGLTVEVEDGERLMAIKDEMQPLLDKIEESLSKNYKSFGGATLTSLLSRSPAAIYSVGTEGMSASQEKFIKSQDWYDDHLMGWNIGKKILQINPNHPVIKKVWSMFQSADEEDQKNVDAISRMLYDYSILSGNFLLEESFGSLSTSLRDGLARSIGVDPNEAPSPYVSSGIEAKDSLVNDEL